MSYHVAQAVDRKRDEAVQGLRQAEAELEELRASLDVAGEELTEERRRLDREVAENELLREKLDASEGRRKAQEEEIALVRGQVRRWSHALPSRDWRRPRGTENVLLRISSAPSPPSRMHPISPAGEIITLSPRGARPRLSKLEVIRTGCSYTRRRSCGGTLKAPRERAGASESRDKSPPPPGFPRRAPPFPAESCRQNSAASNRRRRFQVARLAAQVDADKDRLVAEARSVSAAEATAAALRENQLAARLETVEASLRVAREREREAAAAVSEVEREVTAGRDAKVRVEEVLASALERARAAEESAQAHARAVRSTEQQAAEAAETAMHDKEALRRGLVDAQAQLAGLRAEKSRLEAELVRATAAAAGSEAAAASAFESASTPAEARVDVGGFLSEATTAVAAAAEAAVGQAAEAAAKSAVSAASDALRTRTDAEEKVSLARAEAAEARAEVQRLKLELEAMEAAKRKRSSSHSPPRAGREGGEAREAPATTREAARALREACDAMDKVSAALFEAVEDVPPPSSLGAEGDGTLFPSGFRPAEGSWGRARRGGEGRGSARRRALSADSYASERGGVVPSGGDEGRHRAEHDPGGDLVVLGREARRTSERLRLSAARLLGARREERQAAARGLSRLREELRDAEARAAATAARLEESREVTRTSRSKAVAAVSVGFLKGGDEGVCVGVKAWVWSSISCSAGRLAFCWSYPRLGILRWGP